MFEEMYVVTYVFDTNYNILADPLNIFFAICKTKEETASQLGLFLFTYQNIDEV